MGDECKHEVVKVLIDGPYELKCENCGLLFSYNTFEKKEEKPKDLSINVAEKIGMSDHLR